MKTTVLLLLAVSVFTSSNASISDPPISSLHTHGKSIQADGFQRFNAHRQHNGILLNWTFESSSAISHFIIEKAYDGTNFENVGTVSGISSGTVKYFDGNVYPGYITYRVTAVYTNGTTATSQNETVRIVRNG